MLTGAGNGPVDAFVHALRDGGGFDIHVQNYHEHGVGGGEDATAVAYVQLRIGTEPTVYGVGLDPNIVTATLRAVVSAVNRGIGAGHAGAPAGGVPALARGHRAARRCTRLTCDFRVSPACIANRFTGSARPPSGDALATNAFTSQRGPR